MSQQNKRLRVSVPACILRSIIDKFTLISSMSMSSMSMSSTLISSMLINALFINSTLAANQSSFNPDISLIMDGRYGSYSNQSDYELPGFMLGGEASRGEQGFYLGHNELVISSNVDDMFYAKMTTAIADHEGATEVELEEAYIETLAIGSSGLTLKAGRFYSSIGYLNNQHTHAWDFVDAPLVYRGLFGDQLMDDGLQISWLAPTELYIKFGLEATRGESFPAGGATHDGKGANSVFVKFGGDLGLSQAWQLGFSHWQADVEGRTSASHEHDAATETPSFSGDSKVSGVDFVWKWAPGGNNLEKNLKIQTEYFVRDEDGRVDLLNSDPAETTSYQGKQSGWYLQTIYQFIPRWRLGFRYDRLKADNTGSDNLLLSEAGLSNEDHTPQRSTIMLDYSHSEYSRIRLQIARDDSYEDSDNILFVQYIVSLGAHGAHQF